MVIEGRTLSLAQELLPNLRVFATDQPGEFADAAAAHPDVRSESPTCDCFTSSVETHKNGLLRC